MFSMCDSAINAHRWCISDLMNAPRRIGPIDICAIKHYNMNCMKINHSLGWIFKMALVARVLVHAITLNWRHLNTFERCSQKLCFRLYIYVWYWYCFPQKLLVFIPTSNTKCNSEAMIFYSKYFFIYIFHKCIF